VTSTKNKEKSSFRKKLPHKGKKCKRGEPLNPYGELKKRLSVTLTSTAIKNLSLVAEQEGLSYSEVLERVLRGLISLDIDKYSIKKT
jgi:hypothetical protein